VQKEKNKNLCRVSCLAHSTKNVFAERQDNGTRQRNYKERKFSLPSAKRLALGIE
jgi:hypothetical protein